MQGHPVSEDRAVHPLGYHLQESVGAAPHALAQGRHPLAQHGLETIGSPRGEHSSRAAAPGQPQQPPEGVIVLDAQSTVFAEDLAFPENARITILGLPGARIVSGWEAAEGQVPYQLSLRMVNPTGAVSSCGGSIIHAAWGLTAAHCTATRVTMVVRAGAVSLWRPELIFETFEYFNHPLYIDALQAIVQPHDIAILKFQRTITFSHRVQPIRVQNSLDMNRNYDGAKLVASGWGRTWTDGASPENLQWVYLTGDANERCRSAYGGSSIIIDSTICASAYNVTSQSTCQGDSGGPLAELEEDGKYTLVGVTSFVSSQGCHADMPAGFIRPGHYHDWITDVTGINFDWVPEPPTDSSESKSSESSSSESKSIESSEEKSESKESSESKETSESKSKETSESESKETNETESKETTETESKETQETVETESKETTETESKETQETVETESKETSEPVSQETVETESKETVEAESNETVEAESKETTEAESEEATEETSEEEQSRLFWSVFRGASLSAFGKY
ncbi:transmembrane protease serine 11E-like [Cydia amplana]|uniref:transmembrane protease serine 11E-like n=1 Tax=Cydia amplana TaxID=1869771 RepID=UPI002FE65C61